MAQDTSGLDRDTVEFFAAGKQMKCEECGRVSTSVQRVIDPFRYDIYDQEVWMELCPYCFDGRKYEI